MQKELKDISWNVPESTYRADYALSYSTLAKYEREGYDKLDSLFESISTPSLTEGSMVDCLITGSQEEFDGLFYVADFPSIGDKELQIVNYLFNLYKNNYNDMKDIPATYILEAVNVFDFQKNWKDETRVRVATERGAQYYQLKYFAGQKTIVNTDTYNKVIAMVNALKNSPATQGYFADDDEMSPIRRYYQLKFKATFEGVEYRCMMDECIVDYEDKIIYPIDLKTSHKKEWHFENSFIQWSYFIQARLYAAILKANIEKDEYFKDFKVADYRFIVVNKESLTPLVWEFPYTYAEGDLIDNDGNVFRHPFTIGKELRAYLNFKPQVPNGISIDGINVINCLKPYKNER